MERIEDAVREYSVKESAMTGENFDSLARISAFVRRTESGCRV